MYCTVHAPTYTTGSSNTATGLGEKVTITRLTDEEELPVRDDVIFTVGLDDSVFSAYVFACDKTDDPEGITAVGYGVGCWEVCSI